MDINRQVSKISDQPKIRLFNEVAEFGESILKDLLKIESSDLSSPLQTTAGASRFVLRYPTFQYLSCNRNHLSVLEMCQDKTSCQDSIRRVPAFLKTFRSLLLNSILFDAQIQDPKQFDPKPLVAAFEVICYFAHYFSRIKSAMFTLNSEF